MILKMHIEAGKITINSALIGVNYTGISQCMHWAESMCNLHFVINNTDS